MRDLKGGFGEDGSEARMVREKGTQKKGLKLTSSIPRSGHLHQ